MTIAQKIEELRKHAEYLENVLAVMNECIMYRDYLCSTDENGNAVPLTEEHWNYGTYKVWCEIVEFLEKKAK